MKFKYILTIGLSSLLFSAISNAEEGKPKKEGKKARPSFEAVDTDKDGKVSLIEFTTGKKNQEGAKKRFGRKDKDSDGFLTAEEYAAKGKKARKGKKGGEKPAEENN